MKMSPKKIERLIKTLREQGVEYIKTPEIEIRLREHLPVAVQLPRAATHHSPDISRVAQVPAPPTGAAVPPVDDNIPHHTNEVAKLLKLSDAELVDRLFPDYTAGTG